MLIWIAVGLIVAGMVWVRVAPDDPARWHVALEFSEDSDLSGGVKRMLATSDVSLEALDGEIRATPRTNLLAGSLAEGHITYVTRSRVFGFPDYVTLDQKDDRILLWSRLRYGASDLGVNRTRVEGWLQALGQR